MPRQTKEYRGLSCHRCHKQKVKCTREKPCQNCAAANRPCTYAVRDREVTVSKAYLEKLEKRLSSVNNHAPGSTYACDSSNTSPQEVVASGHSGRQPFDPVAEHPDADVFVSRLKEIQSSHLSPNALQRNSEAHARSDRSDLSSTLPSKYEYFSLKFDTIHAQCTFKLPPYPYAIYLLDQFSIYLGHDWHCMRMTKFRQNLHSIYMTVDSAESKDRVFLCQLLVVLALAESMDASRQPVINQSTDGGATPAVVPVTTGTLTNSPPGKEFFEQALALFNIPYEDATIEHIEILNMFTLYSNQLNRQKTAFMYAGTSGRLCNMLQLHKASISSDLSPLQREHRKRVWWSTFCLDRLTSTQKGLLPTLTAEQKACTLKMHRHK